MLLLRYFVMGGATFIVCIGALLVAACGEMKASESSLPAL